MAMGKRAGADHTAVIIIRQVNAVREVHFKQALINTFLFADFKHLRRNVYTVNNKLRVGVSMLRKRRSNQTGACAYIQNRRVAFIGITGKDISDQLRVLVTARSCKLTVVSACPISIKRQIIIRCFYGIRVFQA